MVWPLLLLLPCHEGGEFLTRTDQSWLNWKKNLIDPSITLAQFQHLLSIYYFVLAIQAGVKRQAANALSWILTDENDIKILKNDFCHFRLKKWRRQVRVPSIHFWWYRKYQITYQMSSNWIPKIYFRGIHENSAKEHFLPTNCQKTNRSYQSGICTQKKLRNHATRTDRWSTTLTVTVVDMTNHSVSLSLFTLIRTPFTASLDRIIYRNYNWPNRAYNIYQTVSNWDSCARNGAIWVHKYNLLLLPVSETLKFAMMDTLEPSPKTINKTQYVLIITHIYSRFTRADPTFHIVTTNLTSRDINSFVVLSEIATFILTFNSTQFVTLCAHLGTKQLTPIAYHPQTKVHIERYSKVILTRPGHYFLDFQRDWVFVVQQLTYAYNTQIYSSTNNLY